MSKEDRDLKRGDQVRHHDSHMFGIEALWVMSKCILRGCTYQRQQYKAVHVGFTEWPNLYLFNVGAVAPVVSQAGNADRLLRFTP
jgi:hypothetical protein